MSRPRVLLVGAGHAHMEAARQASRFEEAGIDVALVDPGVFRYSGSATAVLAGALDEAEASIDPADLMAGAGRFIRDSVEAIDLDAGVARLASGASEAFDFVSLNTGSRAVSGGIDAAAAVPVKPIANLARLRERVLAAGAPLSVAVIGGGATGCEVAANLAALVGACEAEHAVTLISDGPLLADWPARGGRLAEKNLRARGVTIVRGAARTVSDDAIELDDGDAIAADIAVLAAGLKAQVPGGIETAAGGVEVDETLRAMQDRRVFAAGDCAAILGHPRPKLGVFGVRAAPILVDNLIAAATGEGALQRYRPQGRWLSILDMGDGTGLARYDGVVFDGAPALWLKRRIDRGFLDRYR
ncbi:hypothetical protein DDZ18_03250 [Marinicauda salina]|uniref:FAD/NAD(P)-binding domain-containing protein n=1 Tax=Marinicauda salina TaxID=2135793 RepID=A0A2U2BXD1_9PROT|nr:FAD-dependent oxidoreductase [Marinicauda salina]PWE18629.1 hypothetical protein DDZ18_03250 [Marinicauda salina]